MRTRATTLLFTALTVLALGGRAPAQDQPAASQPPMPRAPGGTFDPEKPLTAEADTTTLARIRADTRLSTFSELIQLTAQESLLRSEKITVLAPVNDAFKALPAGELDRLRQEPNRAELQRLVRMHVLTNVIDSRGFATAPRQRTYSGRRVRFEPITVGPQGAPRGIAPFSVRGAKFVQTDVTASNGVMHVMDALVLAPGQSVLQLIQANPKLTRYAQMLKASGVDQVLAGSGSFTVFAPSDEAIDRLDARVLAELLDPKMPDAASKFVRRHIFAGGIYSENAGVVGAGETGVPSMAREPLTTEIKDGRPLLNGTARLVETDAEGSNGVLHVIDDILRITPKPKAPPGSEQ